MKNKMKRFIASVLVCVNIFTFFVIPTNVSAGDPLIYYEIRDCINYLNRYYDWSLNMPFADLRAEAAAEIPKCIKELEGLLKEWLEEYAGLEGSAEVAAKFLLFYCEKQYASQAISKYGRELMLRCLWDAWENKVAIASLFKGKEVAYMKLVYDSITLLNDKNTELLGDKTKIADDLKSILKIHANSIRFPAKGVPKVGGVAKSVITQLVGDLFSVYYKNLDPAYATPQMQEMAKSFGKAVVTGDYTDALITKPIEITFGYVNKNLSDTMTEVERELALINYTKQLSHMAAFNTSIDRANRINIESTSTVEIEAAFKEALDMYSKFAEEIDKITTLLEAEAMLESFSIEFDAEPVYLEKKAFTIEKDVHDTVGLPPVVVMQGETDVTSYFTIENDAENGVVITPSSKVSYDKQYDIYYGDKDYKTVKRSIKYTKDNTLVKSDNTKLSNVKVQLLDETSEDVTFDGYTAYVDNLSKISLAEAENTKSEVVVSYDKFGNAVISVEAENGISTNTYKIYNVKTVKDNNGAEYSFAIKPRSKYAVEIEYTSVPDEHTEEIYVAVYDKDNTLLSVNKYGDLTCIGHTDDVYIKILNFGTDSMSPWAKAYKIAE